jgi:hypothetical protein
VRTLLPIALLLVAVGCGPSNGRNVISGRVTYDGRPLAYGTITFDPDTAKGGRGPQGTAEIRDGQYTTAPDLGPVAGPHVVRVTGWGTRPEEGMLGPPLVSEYALRTDVPQGRGSLDIDIPAPSAPKPKRPR